MDENNQMRQRLAELSELQKYAKIVAKREMFYNISSSDTKDISKALSEFKKDAPNLKTDKAAGGRYKYQSLPGLLSDINPVLAKHGLSLLQPVHTIGDKTYVITIITHTSGQWFRSITAIPEQYTMINKLVKTYENLQAMGGALTYTKRHALKSMLGIDADEDNDGNSPYTQGQRYGS